MKYRIDAEGVSLGVRGKGTMNASQKKNWLGLVISIGLAIVLSVGAIATFGGSNGTVQGADNEPYTMEVQTPDQTGTIGTDKGVKRFQTTDARTLMPTQTAR